MTRLTNHRCSHCGTSYTYQLSGGNAHEHNDGRWCHDCKAAVSGLFKTIPRKYERRMRNVLELDAWFQIPLEQLKAWDADNFEDSKRESPLKLVLRRADMCMFTPDGRVTRRTRRVTGRHKHGHCEFQYTEWSDGTTPPLIEVEMEFDLLNLQWSTEVEANGVVFPVVW